MGYAKLSVIVPAYNERNTIAESVRRARDVELPIEHEVIIVDDGSTDGTRDIIRQLEDSIVRVVYQPQNGGKGTALRAGFEAADGDLIVCSIFMASSVNSVSPVLTRSPVSTRSVATRPCIGALISALPPRLPNVRSNAAGNPIAISPASVNKWAVSPPQTMSGNSSELPDIG